MTFDFKLLSNQGAGKLRPALLTSTGQYSFIAMTEEQQTALQEKIKELGEHFEGLSGANLSLWQVEYDGKVENLDPKNPQLRALEKLFCECLKVPYLERKTYSDLSSRSSDKAVRPLPPPNGLQRYDLCEVRNIFEKRQEKGFDAFAFSDKLDLMKRLYLFEIFLREVKAYLKKLETALKGNIPPQDASEADRQAYTKNLEECQRLLKYLENLDLFAVGYAAAQPFPDSISREELQKRVREVMFLMEAQLDKKLDPSQVESYAKQVVLLSIPDRRSYVDACRHLGAQETAKSPELLIVQMLEGMARRSDLGSKAFDAFFGSLDSDTQIRLLGEDYQGLFLGEIYRGLQAIFHQESLTVNADVRNECVGPLHSNEREKPALTPVLSLPLIRGKKKEVSMLLPLLQKDRPLQNFSDLVGREMEMALRELQQSERSEEESDKIENENIDNYLQPPHPRSE